MISLNFDKGMYHTTSIFQKCSGFLEWEPISLNSERNIVYLLKEVLYLRWNEHDLKAYFVTLMTLFQT